ncbi:MAG: hypothetical protein FD156_1212 [Nitrospirae bacterium]|nr:MAG: hypothetical protein FD156_1212 [Nitrospirota bacterium]
MGKLALYNDEAKRLFVREGFSIDAILGMLDKKVSRKTLFNWKVDGQWEAKRKEYLEQTKEIKTQLKDLVDLTLKNATANPTPKNILALLRSIQAYESYGGIRPSFEGTADEKGGKDNFSPENLKKVSETIQAIYGLKA